jgi:hypothetical protein
VAPTEDQRPHHSEIVSAFRDFDRQPRDCHQCFSELDRMPSIVKFFDGLGSRRPAVKLWRLRIATRFSGRRIPFV